MRRGSIVRITIYGVLAGILASLVAVLIPWLPTSASEQMDRIEFTFWFTTVICIAVFAVVAAVILYSILNFRVPLDDELDGPPIHGHTGLEIVWTAVPAILVTAISIVSAVVLAKNDNAGPNPIRIAVTAQQFAWRFEYPGEAKFTSGQLVLPVNETVKLTLRSLDVIHSFWVPEFGQKSDAVPGIETTLVITPNREGEFSIVCTELCGLGHPTMRSGVRVVDRAQYDQFVAGPATPGGEETSGRGGLHDRRLRRLPRVRARRDRRRSRSEPRPARPRRRAARGLRARVDRRPEREDRLGVSAERDARDVRELAQR